MLSKGIPVSRIGEPEEIGRVAHFLCAGESGYVTGHDFIIDGGASLQSFVHPDH